MDNVPSEDELCVCVGGGSFVSISSPPLQLPVMCCAGCYCFWYPQKTVGILRYTLDSIVR